MQYRTYEQVAKELANEFVYDKNGTHALKDEKNMRHRAYDLKNILAAVGHSQNRGKKLTYFSKATNVKMYEMQRERQHKLQSNRFNFN